MAEELVRLGALRNTWGSVATANLLRLTDSPTALFVASGALIPGVIATLQSYGVVVPDEVSLICFDDVEWFSFTVPKITAISSSQSRLAEAAVTLLLTRIEEPEQRGRAPSLMEIKSELMLRGSTAARQAGLVLRGWNGASAIQIRRKTDCGHAVHEYITKARIRVVKIVYSWFGTVMADCQYSSFLMSAPASPPGWSMIMPILTRSAV